MSATETTEKTVVITCPNCGGTKLAWDYIFRLQESVLDKCARCNATGKLRVPADQVAAHSAPTECLEPR